jgi:hypothetical protein
VSSSLAISKESNSEGSTTFKGSCIISELVITLLFNEGSIPFGPYTEVHNSGKINVIVKGVGV